MDRVVSERYDSSSTDVYYYEADKPRNTKGIRTLKQIREYCSENGIHFDPRVFDFKGKTKKYQGIVGERETNGSVDNATADWTQRS